MMVELSVGGVAEKCPWPFAGQTAAAFADEALAEGRQEDAIRWIEAAYALLDEQFRLGAS